ncbi:MAG: sigma-54-dependent Fis family transcriptional regulator [Verrucomicrobia bacterium]|nr:sigma-54-dependent Fis family transcriptional regulator [Verrucomicrobiota bacterium]
MARILIIEDDNSVASALQDLLRAEGFEVEMSTDSAAGLATAQNGNHDVVITDLQMPGIGGLEIIEQLQAAKPHLPVLLITAFHTTEVAIRAIKLGAFDYILKPIDPTEFLVILKRALESTRLLAKPLAMGDATAAREAIIGKSRVMQEVYKEIGRVAAMPVTVLIQGETGSGKELVARAIHQHSNRAAGPFVTVNCAAIPENLLESELFGHEAGAFTGAKARHIGRFEQANGGTIFLDEIGDMSPTTQVKLLRVLQEKTIQRVGGKETIPIDVRILSATHRNLEEAIESKEFRLDLFHRLNVAVIYLPPLSQRREDIPDLVNYFLTRYSAEFNLERPSIAADAAAFLQQQTWPGNVRELENIVRKALIASRGYPINVDHIRSAISRPTQPRPAGDQKLADYVTDLLTQAQLAEDCNASEVLTEAVERELYGQAIRLANGDQTKAARWLGVSRPTMREKLTRYNLFPTRTGDTSLITKASVAKPPLRRETTAGEVEA